MAYEYNLPGLGLEGFGRAFNAAFQKQQLINIKNKEYADQLSESMRKQNKEGLLPQDLDVYNEKFDIWANANKEKNRLSKGIFTNRAKLTAASQVVDTAKADLESFTEQSRKYKSTAKFLSQTYRDASKVVDIHDLTGTMSDLAQLNTLELNDKYKDGIRTNFEYKEKPETEANLQKDLIRVANADPLAKKSYSIPGPEMDITATIDGVTKTYKVPSKYIIVGMDPLKARNSTYFVFNQNNDYAGKIKSNFINTKNALNNPNDPNYGNAKAAFESASASYGVPVDQINDVDLYSSQFFGIKEENRIQVPDYQAWSATMGQERFGETKKENISKQAKRQSDIDKNIDTSKVDAVKKVLSLLQVGLLTGGIHDKEILSKVNEATRDIIGKDMTIDDINKFQAASQTNNQQMLLDVINIISNNKDVKEAKLKKQPESLKTGK